MTVTALDRPKSGDKVAAIVTDAHDRMRHENVVLEDGSMVIGPEQLREIGNGDVYAGRRLVRHLIAMEKNERVHAKAPVLPSSIRIARETDIPAIFDLIMLDLQENAAKIAPIDETKVRLNIQIAVTGAEKGVRGIVGLIDGPAGKPVAVGMLIPVQWWWANTWYWHEVINFVHPDHRRSNHIDDLIEFERWAGQTFTKKLGYQTHVLFGVLGWRRVRAKIMLYRRKLAMTGAIFLYPSPFEGTES